MLKTLFLAFATMLTLTCLNAQTKAGKTDTTHHAAFYSCAMHPEVVSKQPGKCPECGMELSLSAKEQMKAKSAKVYACPAHLSVVSHNPGKCPKCGKKLNLSSKEQMKAEIAKVYTCPMHPEVALDKDGVCPKCGKDLVEKEPKEKD